MKKSCVTKKMICGMTAVALLVTSAFGSCMLFNRDTAVTADAASGSDAGIRITNELTAKRTQFTKQFAMSDGSFTAATYSMPVHYKKNGKWKEIDTTLKKSGKKYYKTKSTALNIKVSRTANQKSVVSLKRGKTGISVALTGKEIKASKAKISNPKKTSTTDVLNHNTVTYKNVMKNTNISYDIFPEKLQEIVTITKKQKNKTLSFKVNSGKLKVKVKGKKVYFKNKKGKTKYTRMNTVLTDANGVSTSKVKISYDKKTKKLKLTPDKKWWNSKKRKFPIEIRTTYVTDKNSRDVKVGVAYAGTPDSNISYNRSILLQANKSIAFTKMTSLAGTGSPNLQIRDAALHIKSNQTLTLGAGKTFDIGIHKVKQDWKANRINYNNRPAYDAAASATIGIQKAGDYRCDVTDIVRSWYKGEANYGVALVPDNSNRSYQAKIDRNPYFTVHYELVGFEGAVQLAEDQPVTRDVLKAGQENYYYFDAKPGIAYDLYTTSTLDTQGTLYDSSKNRTGYDDNSGLEDNFAFIKSYSGRHYLKVRALGTGKYTLTLKKRFAIPEPAGVKGQDKYTITWNAIENAREYLVSIYDAGTKIGEAVVKDTSYDYIYTNATAGKILGFTVTARENASLTGETSHMVFSTENQSEWVYTTPMREQGKNASAAVMGSRIYVLGGENASGSKKTFSAYDTEKQTWEALPDYPGTQSGICRAAMFAYNNQIYVIGGQTETGLKAQLLSSVYAYNTETRQWSKKADMAEGRTNLAAALSKDKLYVYSKAGATDKTEIYNIKTDTWETTVMPDTSRVIAAASVDDRVFVLQEDGTKMRWAEYLPGDSLYEDAGTECPFAASGNYGTPAVVNGKIYMTPETESRDVLVYDAYTDEWSKISAMNLSKKDSLLMASGNDLYSIGGDMTGYGVLDVVEQYSVKIQTTAKQMSVNKGEAYELQVTAGNLKNGQSKTITIHVDPGQLDIKNVSSFTGEEELAGGTEGVTLLKYQPKKGVMVLKVTGTLEQGETYEACHSIPVEGKTNGKTTVRITMTEQTE